MKRKIKCIAAAAAGAVTLCSLYQMPVYTSADAAFPEGRGIQYLSRNTAAENQQWQDDGRHYKVTTQSDPLNLRAEPATSAMIITTIPRGTIITVLETNGEWGKVQYGSVIGYCTMQWLTLAPAQTAPSENNARENEAIIHRYLTETLGLSSAAACGIIGNIHVETGGTFDPEAHNEPAEGETQGYGICQWNSGQDAGYRLEELQAFTPEWKTLKGQLEFIRHDLLENSYLISLHLYDDLKALKNTEADAVAAADKWAVCYEGCAEWTYAERREKARLYYAEHSGKVMQWKDVDMICVVATESGSLNMRSSASPFGSILTTIPQGAEVTVKSISDDGKWGKVEYNGITGYCAMEYLKQTVPSPVSGTPYMAGDVNGDNKIGPDDAQTVLIASTDRLAGQNMNLTEAQIKAVDIDADGQISAADAQLILIYYTIKYVTGENITWDQLRRQ